MNKVILLLIVVVALGAAAFSGIFLKQSNHTTDLAGTPLASSFILRKDITFTVEGPEYKNGDPNEKFRLAGPDKDLTPKDRTMSRVGTVKIDDQVREVWRCHVYDAFKGRELIYLYVMKDPDKFIMDVYLSEKFWDKKPHDTIIVDDSSIIPVDKVYVDLVVNLNGQEKLYTVIREKDGSPRKEKYDSSTIYSLNTTPVLIGKTVKDLGNLDIYEFQGDTTNISLYGIQSGTSILDGQNHEMFVFGKITGPGASQNISRKSLQLKTIPFVNVARMTWWLPDCKPAIYLYPQKTSAVNVRVFPKGEFTLTIPNYSEKGWNVVANLDGTIQSDGEKYPYLYYEAKIRDEYIVKPKTGYVVQSEDLKILFQTLLPKLGLNQKEMKEFKDYWEKALPKSPYYFVGVMDQKSIDQIEPLDINPNPDSIIRVRLYFEMLEKSISVKQPVITTPQRNGFTVVEWGGMVKTDKNSPFTCSQ